MRAADVQHRATMRAALGLAADHFGLQLVGRPRYGWIDRSIGARARTGSADGIVWLRVVSELAVWAGGSFWEGNRTASALADVSKPEIIGWHDWGQGERVFRAEVMTYISDRPVSSTPQLRTEPSLPADWWKMLRRSLDTLADQRSDRVAVRQEDLTRRLREYFADRVHPAVEHWAVAHTDLHWANLTAPGCYLLDWEGWGMAPAGYDAATLYCHSLLVPGAARTVHEQFADILDTPDGIRSQLLAITRILRRAGDGDDPDLVLPVHRLADTLTGRA